MMQEEDASSDILWTFCTGLIVFVILFIIRQWIKGPQFREKVSGRDLVAIVTGANSGIGAQVVRELNLRYVKVYMMVRDVEKGRNVARELFSRYGCDSTRMIVMKGDLTSFASVREFVDQFDQCEEKLDILVNNAGVMLYPKFEKTVDGHELVLQSNHLGHFLLSELLLPKLEKSTVGGRIVNVSSKLHLKADTADFSILEDKKHYHRLYKTYARSKLCQVMHAVSLTKRIRSKDPSSKITINSCHPGSVDTGLVRMEFYVNVIKKVFRPFIWYFLKTSQDGAQTPLYLAMSKKINGISGKYFSDCALANAHDLASDEFACETLYNSSVEACGLDESRY